jgi:hypothetical protein
MRSFKFLRDNPIYPIDEEDIVKTLLIRLIITGEYETTIYPKLYDNQYFVNNVTVTIIDNEQHFISFISVVGGGNYNFNLSVSL